MAVVVLVAGTLLFTVAEAVHAPVAPVVVGLAVGLLSAALGFSTSWSAAGIGAAIGVVGVVLVLVGVVGVVRGDRVGFWREARPLWHEQHLQEDQEEGDDQLDDPAENPPRP